MLRILFVDDEPHVLDSIADILRPHRKIWQAEFASSGRAALALLEQQSFDVVVSDVRMPDIDGLAVFETLIARWPAVLRIALSGHAEADAARRLAHLVHQSLAKPTSSVGLIETLQRAERVRRLVDDEKVRAVVGRIEKLPPRPRVYGELLSAISSSATNAADIARILEREPALAAKLLQLVNSSFFRLARQISRVEDAVVHLGLEQIRNLVLSAELFQCGSQLSPHSGLSLDQFQLHSLVVARLASRLVENRSQSGEAFLAGIVHDVGLLVLALEMPERFAESVTLARADRRPFHSVLRSVVGVSGAEVGAYLLGLWGLPEQILQAVLHHPDPRSSSGEAQGIAVALHVANALVSAHLPVANTPADCDPLDRAFLVKQGRTDRVATWQRWAREETGDAPARGQA